ncbi:pilus assembly protein [Pandoraea sp. XJJ-1]|uniref:Pilus assembly protein TadG n=1 Tax=Pandoraea cepalis TaxID=2508294 RepID=A0A5E4WRK1_9BURK|nr:MULTISPECIES: TadE/TadG family type IV pilus assembly protein [Pandoraea]MBN9115466.1 pilus assembly protein [Pandoraea sp.]OJY23387.1 MAG: pilus assembly protein TadG [Pandoraea sp. 64-18]QBC32284.1 pilus assembly protein [Pandoraea sp. XY-2]WAL81143.1 pilus assembly protein [Pandoraea sp. XJJ-1]VVE25626.1 pilus assembly protein TadG [Pandoraea cepalis]
MTPLRHRHGNQRGVVAVEFGLVLPVLLGLFGGMVEMGHAIYQYDTLTKSVRNATRYLSEFSPIDPNYPLAGAKCLAVYGNTGCTGTPLIGNLTTSNVVVCDRSSTTAPSCQDLTYANYMVYDATNNSNAGTSVGTINLVSVKISGYQYSPIQAILNFSGLTFGDIKTVMRQVL